MNIAFLGRLEFCETAVAKLREAGTWCRVLPVEMLAPWSCDQDCSTKPPAEMSQTPGQLL